MKTRSLSLSILTTALLALPALAQEEAPAAPAGAENRHREMIKRFDKDGDGRLNEDEKAAARAEMRKDGRDGRGPGARMEGRKKMIKRFDKDGDGKLSDAERAEARKAAEEFRESRQELLKRFDKDGDGVLNDAERAEAKKSREEWMKKGGEK